MVDSIIIYWMYKPENLTCLLFHYEISGSHGNSENNLHRISFDFSVVSPSNGCLEFVDWDNYSGKCYLVCHGETHRPKSY